MTTKTKARKKGKTPAPQARSLDSYVVATPGICGGKPRIAGHRITVANVVVWHDRMGMTADQIADGYDLDLAQIYAALAYYFTHRAGIDERMRQDAQFVKEFFAKNRSPLQDKLNKMGITDGLHD